MKWMWVWLGVFFLCTLLCGCYHGQYRVYTADGYYRLVEIPNVPTCCAKPTSEICPVCGGRLGYSKEKATGLYRYVCHQCKKHWEIVHTRIPK